MAIPLAVGAAVLGYRGWQAYRAWRTYQMVKRLEEAARAAPKAESDACSDCGDPKCDDLYKEMKSMMYELRERAEALNTNPGDLPATRPATPHPRYGHRSIAGEQHQFEGKKQGLRNRLDEWNERNCGPVPHHAYEYANLPTPSVQNPVTPPRLP